MARRHIHFWQASEGHTALCEFLLENNADLHAQDRTGVQRSPVQAADLLRDSFGVCYLVTSVFQSCSAQSGEQRWYTLLQAQQQSSSRLRTGKTRRCTSCGSSARTVRSLLTSSFTSSIKLVLSGHAASLTPYQSDTPRPSPRQYALLMRGVYLFHTEQACLHPHEDSVPGGPAPVPPRSTRALTPPAPRAVKRVDAFGMAPVDYAKGEALSTLNMIMGSTGHKAV